MDLRTLIRYIKEIESDRAVARDTGLDRRTIGRYRKWAKEQGLLEPEAGLPSLEEFAALVKQTLSAPPPPQNLSSVEPYRQQVETLYNKQVEGTAIFERLKEQGYTGSRSAVYRFIRKLTPAQPEEEVTVRVEQPPGDEAQVDFGHAGELLDPETGELRKAYVFVMTLSYSRHMYIEFVWQQDVPTWLLLHRHAFEFFGGVPKAVRLDNLKAGIIKNSRDGTDPLAQWAYQECAEHYGFLLRPCRPYTPEHKGKVESGVHYVKRNHLAGKEARTLPQANQEGLSWCLETAGQRQHGTTKQKPLEEFERVEKAKLRPLPVTPYDLASWKEVKVQRDCFLTFEGAYYSVPFRLVGQKVRVRGGSQTVKLYNQQFEPVATHSRATQPGQRLTNPDHLPPTKLPALQQSRESVLAQAEEVGVCTHQVIERLLADPVIDRLDSAGRLVRLRYKAGIGEARLEAACRRSLAFGEASYKVVKQILKEGLEAEPLSAAALATTVVPSGENSGSVGTPVPVAPPEASLKSLRFKREAKELVGHLFRAGAVALSVAGGLALEVVGKVGGLWS